MNNATQTQKGIYLAMAAAVISGFAVFFNKFAMSFWGNSSVFTTAKNLIAVLFLMSLIILLKKFPEIKNLSKKQWFLLIAIGFIGGSIPFLLFFKGLSLASATSAAFIHKTLFIWVALLAMPFLKEKISGLQFLALGMLAIGIYLFAPSMKFRFGYGELLIFSATILWALENIIAKIVLRNVSSFVLGWGRMFFGSIFLLAYLSYGGGLGQLFVFSGVKTGWLFLSGFILFGYVVSWYSALKFAPATAVSAILTVAALITGLLDAIFVTHRLSQSFVLPAIFIIVALLIYGHIPEKISSLLKRKAGWVWMGY